MNELKFLEEQGVNGELIRRVEEFRRTYEVPAEAPLIASSIGAGSDK